MPWVPSLAINVVRGGTDEHIVVDAADVKIVSNLILLGAARRFRTRLSTASHKNQDRLTVGEGKKREETVIWGSTSCSLDCGKNSSSTQINLTSRDCGQKLTPSRVQGVHMIIGSCNNFFLLHFDNAFLYSLIQYSILIDHFTITSKVVTV